MYTVNFLKYCQPMVVYEVCSKNTRTIWSRKSRNWYSTLFAKLPNGQTSICAHQSVDFVNLWVVSWRWRTSRTLIVVNRLSTTLETLMPLETCSSLHSNIAVSRVEHGKWFSCRFPEFYTKFLCNSLILQAVHPTNEKNILYLKPCSSSTNEDICGLKTAF